jgi:hypothetical protein
MLVNNYFNINVFSSLIFFLNLFTTFPLCRWTKHAFYVTVVVVEMIPTVLVKQPFLYVARLVGIIFDKMASTV